MSESRPCIFGEVLFDIFPDGNRVLGGAPFNVAWHLQAFGTNPVFISRVGNDENGELIRQHMKQWGLDQSELQTDKQRATGEVKICFEEGEPQYEIVENVAYDFINTTTDSVLHFNLIYHGSLALRNEVSATALMMLKNQHKCPVFLDVNLRSPWWTKDNIQKLLHNANWVKLNEAELKILLDCDDSLKDQATKFLERYNLDIVVVTLGAKGAMTLSKNGEANRVQPEETNNVVDTVGAGDAFTSVIILGLLQNWPIDLALQRAQAFASKIVGQQGATVSDRTFYQKIINEWET